MQRFNSWNIAHAGDFWTTKFRPKEFIRATAHANSVLSQRKDARLLERYDINDLATHKYGTCYIWVPITLDPPEYDETQEIYKWVYTIDKNWLSIDAIYDKHVDPEINLQHDIDFIYEESSGKIYSAKKIINSEGTLPPLYISKGWYAEYRIYNEYGHFLNYSGRDSRAYRDSLDPILAALYVCPTYFYLLAVLNVMIGLPVAKYGDETVTSIFNGIVTTDKYSYDIGCVHTNLSVGDKLIKFQPITDAVELNTYFGYDEKTNRRTKNKWWLGRPPDFFSKYVPEGVQMTNELRDYLMETYLYRVVAGIEFRQDKLGNRLIDLNTSIQDIFLDAANSRSDFVFVQSYHVGTSYDVFNLMTPTKDYDLNTSSDPKDQWTGIRLHNLSMYGEFDEDNGENAQFCYSTKVHIPVPRINRIEEFNEDTSFSFKNGIWHLYSKTGRKGVNEFWRYRDKTDNQNKVLVEPWKDFVYLRTTATPFYMDSQVKCVPTDLEEAYKPTVFLNLGEPSRDSYEEVYRDETGHEYHTGYAARNESGAFSNMTNLCSLTTSIVDEPLFVADNSTYSALDIQNMNKPVHWDLYNVILVSKNNKTFLTVQTDSTTELGIQHKGYINSPIFKIGIFPKTITPSIKELIIPVGAAINLEYSKYIKKTVVPGAKGRVPNYAFLESLSNVNEGDIYIVTDIGKVFKAHFHDVVTINDSGTPVITKSLSWILNSYIKNPITVSELAILQQEYISIGNDIYYWDSWTPITNETPIPDVTEQIKFKIKLFENANILNGKPYFGNFQLKLESDE